MEKSSKIRNKIPNNVLRVIQNRRNLILRINSKKLSKTIIRKSKIKKLFYQQRISAVTRPV